MRRSNDVEGFTQGYPVTHSDFWTLIGETLTDSGGDDDRQRELLLARLTALPPDEIASFEGRFHYYSELAADRAYTMPGALRRTKEIISNDGGWECWRAWLISRSQETYFAALVAREFEAPEAVSKRCNGAFESVPYEALELRPEIGEDGALDYIKAYVSAHEAVDVPLRLPLEARR